MRSNLSSFAQLLLCLAPLLLAGSVSAQADKPAPSTNLFGIANASVIAPGVIGGAQPTADQLRAAAAAGYKGVLDLRGTAEDRGFDENATATALGLSYLTLPVTMDNLDGATIDRFRETYRTAPKPLLVHCASSNRVGALLYSHWVLDEGMAPEEAMTRAKAAGLKSPELAEKIRTLVEEKRARKD